MASTARLPVNASNLLMNIELYKINAMAVGCCLPLNLVNLCVFLGTRRFRSQYLSLILLSCASLMVLLGILLEALSRIEMFEYFIAVGSQGSVSSRDCLIPWVLVQTFGDFWAPSIELCMGVERLVATNWPSLYRRLFAFHTGKIMLAVTVCAFMCVLTPSAITFVSPNPSVNEACGRKATFSTAFGIVDYLVNVAGYATALILNVCAVARAAHGSTTESKHMQKLRCYIGVSFLSTVLISVPNLFSVINALIVRLPDQIMTPAVVMACLNCGLQFFVFLALNSEYRKRLWQLVCCGKARRIIIVVATKEARTHVPSSQVKPKHSLSTFRARCHRLRNSCIWPIAVIVRLVECVVVLSMRESATTKVSTMPVPRLQRSCSQ